jgi:kynurenine formamidase
MVYASCREWDKTFIRKSKRHGSNPIPHCLPLPYWAMCAKIKPLREETMIIDLTMPLDERTPPFPGDDPFVRITLATFAEQGWNSCRIAMPAHFGTHIDAPLHMSASGKSLSDFAAADFIGPACVLDVRGHAAIGPEQIPAAGLLPFVLLWTGHSRRLYEPDYFTSCPVLTLAGAQRLIAAGVRLIGIDTHTVDHHPYPVHKLLFAHDIRIIENLVNLDLIGATCRLIALPLNLTGGDGAPARVVAEVP